MEMGLEEEAEQPQTTVHALLLSFPTRTHLVPLIQLAKRLAGVGNEIKCCKFVFTNIVSYQVAGEAGGGGEEDEDAGFTLRTIGVPDGLPWGQGKDMLGMIQACNNMKASTLRFLPHLQQSPGLPLSLIISDVFVPWAAELASSLGLPLFFFYTTNAASCCVMSHAPSLLAHHIIPFNESSHQELVPCPGAPMLLPRDFPFSMQLQDISHPQFQFTLNMFSHLEEATGLILNTCHEIEADAVKALQARCPVYTVGPLFLPISEDLESVTNQKQIGVAETDDCLKWLDSQSAGSVLYVSFGTLANFSNVQMSELALGLEKSQQPFLWVVHKNVFNGVVSDALPEGFLERVKDRCFVASWVPQLQVLKHRSVGGFFSHCGWNSILENITLKGVPMLCWPDKAEQGVNARILVDVWKLGMPFRVGKDCNISCDEVEAAVKTLMEGEEAEEMKRRGAELKKQVETVRRKGGSSMMNLEALVMTIRSKVSN
ncbi:hypothetical protein GOP47_0025700 [Adiantum capillus-veneris]|uniref:Glycosyltransferase n=1 Tax=Adiantum capillus-veneris TaxID=13818 RepID=A0A9D4Z4D2_ADICA|nr:hypothetical protein GOP47_0025700 [Adiantum capillus-veneris]